MSSKEFDRIPLAENAPTPEQLFKLASVCIKNSANEGKLLRPHHKVPRAYMWGKSSHETPGFEDYHHSLFGIIGRKTLGAIIREEDQTELFIPSREWSLQIVESHSVKRTEHLEDRNRIVYQLGWNDNETLVAQQTKKIFLGNSDVGTAQTLKEYMAQPRELSARRDYVATTPFTDTDCEEAIVRFASGREDELRFVA
ncbi:MAG: hypothetical protein JWM07_221 [Candidatus Saccharibacteria bacterium]|jgi:hypothetical protein|nr:hypothetical protein [Candidatus Saccharibacteria bacterium]